MEFNKPDRSVDQVFIHCSATDNSEHDDVEVIRKWHTDPKPHGRGWSEIGYHFFIRKSGRIEFGRPLERTPAAQRGHNTGTIAICLHGLKAERFTKHQFKALAKLGAEIDEAYDSLVTFHGHCEVAAKECPVFDYRRVLGLSGDGAMTKPADVERQVEPSKSSTRPVLRRTARGDTVTLLQDLLKLEGIKLVADGIFGRETFEAVVQFQLDNTLKPDGVVGPATWAALIE